MAEDEHDEGEPEKARTKIRLTPEILKSAAEGIAKMIEDKDLDVSFARPIAPQVNSAESNGPTYHVAIKLHHDHPGLHELAEVEKLLEAQSASIDLDGQAAIYFHVPARLLASLAAWE